MCLQQYASKINYIQTRNCTSWVAMSGFPLTHLEQILGLARSDFSQVGQA